MALAFLIGRLIFGGFFLFSAVNHLLLYGQMVQYTAAKGVPMADVAVLIATLLLFIGSISILLGWRPEIGITALVVFLVAVSFPMHNFWAVTSAAERMTEMGNFMKNMALLGATLMMAAVPQPWPYSIETRRRFTV